MITFTEYYNVVIIRIEVRVHTSRCRYSEGVTHFLGQGLNQPTYVIHSLYCTLCRLGVCLSAGNYLLPKALFAKGKALKLQEYSKIIDALLCVLI